MQKLARQHFVGCRIVVYALCSTLSLSRLFFVCNVLKCCKQCFANLGITNCFMLLCLVLIYSKTIVHYIHGFAKLNPRMVHYIFVCSLCSYVSDGLLASLLEDPRVPSRMDEVLECMQEKLTWLESLDLGVIGLMAPLAGISSVQLLSDIIVAGHVAASFFDFRVLFKARQPSWVWETGDHEWKLKILLEQDPPTKP